MTIAKRLVTATTGILLVVSIVCAQQQQNTANSGRSAATITAAAAADRVRFTAPSSVVQMRLEVYNANGEKVFDNEIRGGNVIDWLLQNGQAERLSDGSYLCVITGKSLSGRISQRVGSVTLANAAATLQPVDSAQLTAKQSEAVGPLEENAAITVLKEDENQTATVIAHNGTEGQITRGRGALSFRLGDFFAGKDTEQMRLTEEGNLGIGTSDPRVKLDVAGMIGAREGVMFSDGSTLGLNKKGILTHTSATGDLSPSISGTGTTNQITKWSDGPTGVVADSALFESGGNVGLGTTSPDSIFHLAGPAGVNALTFNTPGTARGRFGTLPGIPDWLGMFLNGKFSGGGWLLDNTARTGWFFKLDNRIGVDEFAVYKIPPGAGPHTDEFPRFVLRSSGGGALGTMPLGYTPAATLDVVSDGSLDVLQWRGTAGGGALGAIKANGNVGIGTTTPGAKLDVAGDIQVSGNAVIAGNIAAKYQDLAEWVPARKKLAAGTVVSLDLNRTNAVVPSARAYDTHIAGVISSQPGVILGQDGPGKVLVATTGRVKVKVDATRHPIKIGDLLVTSDKSGVAMKSLPIRAAGTLIHRPGTIIGKALEPLSNGKGEILVLLSLQ